MITEDAGREARLWAAALALLVADGQAYWQGLKALAAEPDELEEAFDSLVQCTWTLKRICAYTGHDAEWISNCFNQWCESH